MAVGATLQAWVDAALAHWRGLALRRFPVERHFHSLADRAPNLRLYNFAEGGVTLQALEAGRWIDPALSLRAEAYLRFFADVARLLPGDINTTLCVCVGDLVGTYPVPVFGFQKRDGDATLLLPDIDFLINDFYESDGFRDGTPYGDKQPRAVFAGATTGEMIDEAKARAFATPRLRAAQFFLDKAEVDFRLPVVAQCVTEAARVWLEAQIFCQAPRLDWAAQFASRFLISMDGNGATCSRVAVALGSNSVLLKYRSDYVLYYFAGLVPHVHYVPVAEDGDVLAVIAAENASPGRYAAIPPAANAFARSYLTRACVLDYTARLVAAYAAMLGEGDDAESPVPARRVAAVGRGSDGTETLAEGSGWAGAPGGGAALVAVKMLSQPRASAPRLMYQVLYEDGRFSPMVAEGNWCGDGRRLAAIRLVATRAGGAMDVSVEVRFVDGSTRRAGLGVACRAASGAAIEAFRVHLS
jgi:hypothetical protein